MMSSRIQSEYASFRWQALPTLNQDNLGRPTLPWRTGSVLCQDAILRFYDNHHHHHHHRHHHHGHRLRHHASWIWSVLSPPFARIQQFCWFVFGKMITITTTGSPFWQTGKTLHPRRLPHLPQYHCQGKKRLTTKNDHDSALKTRPNIIRSLHRL